MGCKPDVQCVTKVQHAFVHKRNPFLSFWFCPSSSSLLATAGPSASPLVTWSHRQCPSDTALWDRKLVQKQATGQAQEGSLADIFLFVVEAWYFLSVGFQSGGWSQPTWPHVFWPPGSLTAATLSHCCSRIPFPNMRSRNPRIRPPFVISVHTTLGLQRDRERL